MRSCRPGSVRYRTPPLHDPCAAAARPWRYRRVRRRSRRCVFRKGRQLPADWHRMLARPSWDTSTGVIKAEPLVQAVMQGWGHRYPHTEAGKGREGQGQVHRLVHPAFTHQSPTLLHRNPDGQVDSQGALNLRFSHTGTKRRRSPWVISGMGLRSISVRSPTIPPLPSFLSQTSLLKSAMERRSDPPRSYPGVSGRR
jgi:hypothetical protein